MWQLVLVTSISWGAAPVPPVDPNKPPLVSPKRLVEAFLTNEAFADERYADKTIEVRGKVVRISRSGRAECYCLYLDTEKAGDGRDNRLDLLFLFDLKDRKALAALNPGDLVTVQGRCTERIVWTGQEQKGEKDYSRVQLRGCSIVRKNDNTPPQAPTKP